MLKSPSKKDTTSIFKCFSLCYVGIFKYTIENYVKKNRISSLVGDLTLVRGTCMVLMLVI